MILDSSTPLPKRYTYGTHRSCTPAETLARIEASYPALGITRIADVTGLDRLGIPVCMAIRPNSRSLSVSQGKGMTLTLAKASAAMEAAELFHAENVAADLRGSYRSLSQEWEMCDPEALPLASESAFDADLELAWSRGYDLLNCVPVLVPYDLVHCAYLAHTTGPPAFLMTSNGLASGNHLLEAIVQGVCEVIERDASALWRIDTLVSRVGVPSLALETVDSEPACFLIERIAAAGLDTVVWNQTTELGVPCFRAAIGESSTSDLEVLGSFDGMGCHLSKEVALLRALTEAVQSRLTSIAGSRDDMFRHHYRVGRSPLRLASWRRSRTSAAIEDYSQIPSLETDDIGLDLAKLLSLLRDAGIERVVAVDLTRPEFRIPVVRIVIPSLEFCGHTQDSDGRRARLHRLTRLLDVVVGLDELRSRVGS